MVTLKCTQKLLKQIGGETIETPIASTSALGDWYANAIPTCAGELVVFANERTLLSVAIPASEIANLIPLFQERVINLLHMLEIEPAVIARELYEFSPIEVARTSSRRVLGSLNEIALNYQFFAEDQPGREHLSLSEAELQLSTLLHSPLKYRYPADVAKELLSNSWASEAKGAQL